MSSQRKKRTPPVVKENACDYFTPIPTLQKKVKNTLVIPKNGGKSGRVRKVRRTEKLLFWDVAPLEFSMKPPSLSSTKTTQANIEVLQTNNETLSDLPNKANDSSMVKSRRIIKAKRHFRENNVENVMNNDFELQIPTHQIRNLKTKIKKDVDETATVAILQTPLEIESQSVASTHLRNSRFSNDHNILKKSLTSTPVPWKNKIIDSSQSNENNKYFSRSNKAVDSFNCGHFVFPSEKTSKSKSNESIPTTSVRNDTDQSLNITYDKLPDVNIEEVSMNEKSTSVITIHDSQSFISLSKSGTSALPFNCSLERIRPSLEGSVKTSETKRRTFELEKTVTDISLLRAEAGQNDSFVANNFPHHLQQPKSRPSFSSISTPITLVGSNVLKPSASSTPAVNASASKIEKQIKKTASKVKMPNFAAIHEKAFNHMESISDYKKRKENRAKMLLSGKKPLDISQIQNVESKSKKQLRFASDTSDRIKSSFIPLPTTPMPKNGKDYSTIFEHLSSDDTKVISKKLPTNGKYGKENDILKKDNKISITCALLSKTPILQEKDFNSVTNVLKMTVQNPNHIKNRSNVEIIKPIEKKVVSKKENLKKEDVKTMIVTKCNIKQDMNLKNKKRLELAGVRSNRRFDLLMKMRKKGV